MKSFALNRESQVGLQVGSVELKWMVWWPGFGFVGGIRFRVALSGSASGWSFS